MYTDISIQLHGKTAVGYNFLFPAFPAGSALLTEATVDCNGDVNVTDIILSYTGEIINFRRNN
jgi:hypothetical protein